MIRHALLAVSTAAVGWSAAALGATPSQYTAERFLQQKPANSGRYDGTPAHPLVYPDAESGRSAAGTVDCRRSGDGEAVTCTPGESSGSSQPGGADRGR